MSRCGKSDYQVIKIAAQAPIRISAHAGGNHFNIDLKVKGMFAVHLVSSSRNVEKKIDIR